MKRRKQTDTEYTKTPEEFIKRILNSSPDKIVLTEMIEEENIAGKIRYCQIIEVYIKGNEEIGGEIFETTEDFEKRKKEGFVVKSSSDSDMTPAWESVELSLQENGSLWEYCKKLNYLSYEKISNQIIEWNRKIDSQIKSEWLLYFANVQGIFDEWYYLNKNNFQTKIPFPDRKMKDIVVKTTQLLFDSDKLTYKGNETETNPIYSQTVIKELQNTYDVTNNNILSITKYFTRGDINISQKKNGAVVKKISS